MSSPQQPHHRATPSGEGAHLPLPSRAVREFFGESLGTVTAYAELLATAGIEWGVLGPREVPRIWERHLANSAVVERLVPSGSRVVDLGSGAGLPGIPLACVRPDLAVELVEPQQRRVRFLEECLRVLELPRVSVTRARAEDLAGAEADCVVARAVAPLDRLAAIALPVLRPGGVLLALKGERAEEEISGHRRSLAVAGGVQVHLSVCGVGVVDPPARVVVVARSDSDR